MLIHAHSQVHFEPEMWEKTRQDGTRKLKNNAVPTIFSFAKPKPKRKPPVERKIVSPKRRRIAHNEPGPSSMENLELSSPESEIVDEPEPASGQSTTPQHTEEKLRKYEVVYKKATQRANKHRNELRKIKRSLNTMMRHNEEYIKDLQSDQLLKKVFNP